VRANGVQIRAYPSPVLKGNPQAPHPAEKPFLHGFLERRKGTTSQATEIVFSLGGWGFSPSVLAYSQSSFSP
jgi:hypothetical protein